MARARPRPTLADRAETIDHELAAAVRVPAGKGHRCQRSGCEREATRWAAVWRCDHCPDPAPITISAEIDPTGNDPHRRWPWTTSRKAALAARGRPSGNIPSDDDPPPWERDPDDPEHNPTLQKTTQTEIS